MMEWTKTTNRWFYSSYTVVFDLNIHFPFLFLHHSMDKINISLYMIGNMIWDCVEKIVMKRKMANMEDTDQTYSSAFLGVGVE